MENFEGKPILCKAAIAYEAKKPLVIEEIYVDPPKEGQVRIKVISNALCHTDVYRLDGCDPEGEFPCILGHEATGVVESIGKGVTRVQVGDIVIPCYTPQCNQKKCIYCQHEKTNLCPKIRNTQGNGVMPDGTSRFRTKQGKTIFHFMGCSTFAEYTVIAEISAAKINKNADLNKVCMIGCGVATGWGAAINNTHVEPGSTVAVWGLGAVGLAVIQAAKTQGAAKIYGIDINEKKFDIAKKFGADVCYKPTPEKSGKAWLLEQQKWGIGYTYDCTGNVGIMREALEASHRGFGESCVIGVAEAGKEIATRSFQLVTGRKWVGTAFGGWKAVDDVPKLVNKAALGEWPIDAYVTHEIEGLEKVNDAIHALHHEFCLRAVVKISEPPKLEEKIQIKVTNSVKLEGGSLKTVSHWSKTLNSFMNFNVYLPDEEISHQRGQAYPGLYFLAGLTSNHENAPIKSGFAKYAKKHRLAMIFPDTSPRNTGIAGIAEDWEAGDSASYYVNATADKYKQFFQMFTYINEELPELVSTYFPISRKNISITGFSMGGHGALISALKTGQFKSVSAFAPMGNPTKSANWGIKAFKMFFNDAEAEGKDYDTVEIIRSGKFHKVPMLVDVGTADQFKDKLLFDNLREQLIESDYAHLWRSRGGYNHSFWYVSTFIEEHIEFHAKYLNYETL